MRIIQRILGFFPVPFWVYFLSILAGTCGILPHQSPVYDFTMRHMLPAAIILMLIGTPLTDLVRMGPKATVAMFIGTGTIFFAQVLAYLLLIKFLPSDAWKSVGALMGTWIGGSANMIAVKEILGLPDSGLSPLVIVDTILSYTWMALLLSGVRLQAWFDKPFFNITDDASDKKSHASGGSSTSAQEELWRGKIGKWFVVTLAGFIIGEVAITVGKLFGMFFLFLSVSGWALLFASTAALLLALTPLKNLKGWGSHTVGTFLLYLVLVTIGVKTNVQSSVQSSVFLLYGIMTLLIHGALALGWGRWWRVPLYLLSTSSQANIGGAVSAPIVAETYRSGTAHIGVLMAVTGAVLGTYLGVAGGYLCRTLGSWLLKTPL